MRPLPPEWFTQNRVDTVLIRTSEAIQDPLLTGFTNLYPTDFTFFFIQSPQRKHFICGHMEKGAVKKNYRGPLTVIQKKSDWVRALKPFMRGKRVGINLPYLTAAQLANLKKEFPRTRFTDVSGALEETRKIKEKDEQKKLMEGARITQEVLHGMHHVVKTGMKEIELAAEIDHQFHKNGCTNSFSTIVAFGKNSRNIHHYNSSAKLRKGDVILMDAGARYQGYCADLSRTFVFGNATSEQEKWYALC
ncbi:MAG: Xaa-Pro peptidase family protein, partial [archaeon]|nr:Xaa-Pro peptidase family protein [archaeon]